MDCERIVIKLKLCSWVKSLLSEGRTYTALVSQNYSFIEFLNSYFAFYSQSVTVNNVFHVKTLKSLSVLLETANQNSVKITIYLTSEMFLKIL